jgi:tricorn protease interacting factor F2/3
MTESDKHESIGTNIVPKNYKLYFEPDLKSFKTYGKETISLFVKTATDCITLNSKEITIFDVTASFGGRKLKGKIKEIKEKETIEITFNEKIIGEGLLEIDFENNNNDKLYGFYRSRYYVSGKQKYMLTTDFEPASARAAFPCIDEPEFKATFDISLKIDMDLEAISNMPKISEKLQDKKKIIVFDTTPKMSTYLLYIGVGEFESVSDEVDGIKISAITTPEKKHGAELPLSYAKKAFVFLQNYFGIKYPLPKLDLIAIPDFASAAMENWGALTFRESCFLLDAKSDTTAKRDVFNTIAHELTHQWFGNLVTMKWWNDTWLNESFAELMSYNVIEKIFPEWRVDLEYLRFSFDTAFEEDSFKMTHPISVKVNDPDEIAEIFDTISYRKGGSILKMLEDYVGEETFRKGLRTYLEKHAYGNAIKSDLWDAIASAGKDFDIKKIIEAWIDKPGYPIVHVKPIKKGFSLEQKRFLFSGEKDEKWPIPLRYLTKTSSGSILFGTNKMILNNDSNWIKLNYGQHGFYRVNYPDKLLTSLGILIKEHKLGAADAWGIENDLFVRVKIGDIKTEKYLDFINKFCTDPEYPLSENLFLHLGWLYAINQNRPLADKVRKIGINISKKLLKKLGWSPSQDESDIQKISRINAISRLGLFKEEETTKKLLTLFKSIEDGQKINPDLLPIIYAVAAINGDSKTFKILKNLYNKTDSPDEREAILIAIGRFRSDSLILKALDFSLSDEVRIQDSFFTQRAVALRFENGDILFKWIKSNWKTILKNSPPTTKLIAKYINPLSILASERAKKEFKAFFSAKENYREDIKYPFNQTLENIDLNIKYLKNN